MTLDAGTRLGPYEILSLVGSGGMGEVYRARDAALDRLVAIKVLPGTLASDPAPQSRFEREARLASALNHPNIITIYSIGREGTLRYIAMELVDGQTLYAMMAEGPLPLRRVADLAAQIAAGLAKAHEAGIVHRDLKPQNVMVTKDGLAKILDFGLGTLGPLVQDDVSELPTIEQPAPLTGAGVILGTVQYMSPEQASARPVDFRSDQFSFGSMLYEMVTSRRAFARPTAVQTLSAIIEDPPVPIADISQNVPDLLQTIVERCLAKDPRERFASTQDLARDVELVRDRLTQTRIVRPATISGASRRRLRTRLTWLLATCVVAVIAVAVVTLFIRERMSGWLRSQRSFGSQQRRVEETSICCRCSLALSAVSGFVRV